MVQNNKQSNVVKITLYVLNEDNTVNFDQSVDLVSNIEYIDNYVKIPYDCKYCRADVAQIIINKLNFKLYPQINQDKVYSYEQIELFDTYFLIRLE